MKGTTRLVLLFWLSAIEALIATRFLFLIPSEQESVYFLGVSRERFWMGISFLVIALLLLVLSLVLSTSAHIRQRTYRNVVAFLESSNCATYLISFLVFFTFAGIVFTIVMSSSFIPENNFPKVVFLRTRSIFIWGTLILLQAALVLGGIRKDEFHERVDLNSPEIQERILIALLSTVLICQWLMLIFNLPIFTYFEHWYWHYYGRELINPWLFFVILFVMIAASMLVLRNRQAAALSIVALMVLGYGLQIGVGMIEGGGYKAIGDRYLQGGRPDYAELVADTDFNISDLFTNEYEGQSDHFIGTKPPGYFLLYAGLQELTNPGHQASSFPENLDHLVGQMSIYFPLISMSVLPFMALIGKQMGLSKEQGVLSSAVYIVLPSVLLFTLQLDQVLIPLVYIVGVYLGIKSIQEENAAFAFITGIVSCVAILISYSLVALLPMLFIYFALNRFPGLEPAVSFIGFVRVLAGFVIGFLVVYGALVVLFNFHMYTEFLRSFTAHDISKGYSTGRDLIGSVMLNISELIHWLSFPAAVLLVMQALESIRRIARRQIGSLDILFLASILLVLLLLVFGSTQGEVARLWMFMFPLFSIFIAVQLINLFRHHSGVVYLFLAGSLCTSVLMLRYQFPYQ